MKKNKLPMTMEEIEAEREHQRKYHPNEFYVIENNKDEFKEIKFTITEKIGIGMMNVQALKRKGKK